MVNRNVPLFEIWFYCYPLRSVTGGKSIFISEVEDQSWSTATTMQW